MTTMTMTNGQRISLKPLIVAMILIALAVVSMHALAKHGQAAVMASQCADSPQVRMRNPVTSRIAFVCLTETGWGVVITERDGQPVTSFLREKAKRLEQVIRYLRNGGYELIQ